MVAWWVALDGGIQSNRENANGKLLLMPGGDRYGMVHSSISATKCNKKRSLLKEINESYKRKTLRFQQQELTAGEVLRVVDNCLNLIFVFYLKFN